jgi:hypothetical protein
MWPFNIGDCLIEVTVWAQKAVANIPNKIPKTNAPPIHALST